MIFGKKKTKISRGIIKQNREHRIKHNDYHKIEQNMKMVKMAMMIMSIMIMTMM